MSFQVVETRLFSEGLHTLGQPPSPEHMRQYLEAYFDNALSTEAVDLVAASDGESLDAVKAKLQRIYSQVTFCLQSGLQRAAARLSTCSRYACLLSIQPK